ncbi:MAG: molybdopterin cofactor-binding domain-containing protein [Chloroflexota bacterium]
MLLMDKPSQSDSADPGAPEAPAASGRGLSRRHFLQLTGGAGAGLFVLWSSAACGSVAVPSASPKASANSPAPVASSAPASAAPASTSASASAAPAGPVKSMSLDFRPGPPPPAPPAGNYQYPKDRPAGIDSYLQFAPDGGVTLMTGKLEFGQGIQTAFAQIVADELDVPFEKVSVVMGITNKTPFDIGTFGSLSVRATGGPVIRQAAAMMHGWLVQLGASKLGVAPTDVSTKNGSVFVTASPSKSVGYGALAAGQKSGLAMNPKAPVKMKDPASFNYIGKSVPRLDIPFKVNGAMKYGYDAMVPGMKHGVVLRAPSNGATLTSVDTTAASTMPGVKGVVHVGDFVAIAADRMEQARAAVAAIKSTWQENPLPVTDKTIHDYMKAHHDQGGYISDITPDAAQAAAAKAVKKVSIRVTSPYLAHGAIEPMTALVSVQPDKTEVWTSTQDPFTLQDFVANQLKVPHDQVIITPLMSGGAFGRKAYAQDVVVEALKMSQALKMPVRVNWNRQEEFQLDRFKPATLIELETGLDANNNIAGWYYTIWYADRYPAGQVYPQPVIGADNAHVLDVYTKAIPNVASISYFGDSQFPTYVWRSNGGGVNSLAREAALDQLAEAAGMDPISFRAKLLTNSPRLLAVMQAAVKQANWTPGVGSTGKGIGIGITTYDGTHVAEVAHVTVDKTTGKVQVTHVDVVADVGLAINPDGVKYQMEGGVVSQGITHALKEGITFANGRVTNDSFAQYGPATQLDAPSVTVSVMPNEKDPPSAVGEPGVVPFPAAVSNAIYDAVGVRVLDMPFTPDKVLAAIQAKK